MAALVAALAANWLRAFFVVTLATLTERRLGVGLDHVALGWLIYAALIAALILYARKFADTDDRPQAPGIALAASGGSAPMLAGAGALIVAAAAYLQLVVNNPAASVVTAPIPAISVEGWRAVPSSDAWRAHAPQSDAARTLQYFKGAASVIVAHQVLTHDRPGAEIASFEVRAADGESWRRIATDGMKIEIAGARKIITVETLENLHGERIIVAAAYRVGDRLFTSQTSAKLAIVTRKLAGARTDGGALFVAARIGGERDIAAFIEAMEPVADWRERAFDAAKG
jgi:EpsI family protein